MILKQGKYLPCQSVLKVTSGDTSIFIYTENGEWNGLDDFVWIVADNCDCSWYEAPHHPVPMRFRCEIQGEHICIYDSCYADGKPVCELSGSFMVYSGGGHVWFYKRADYENMENLEH